MRKLAFISFLILLLTACASSSRSHGGAGEVPPMPYMRVSNTDSNIVQLQIAVRKFIPAHSRGPVIWLVGAAHLGDPDYYRALQRHLDTQTLVLYEGVGPHPGPTSEKEAPAQVNDAEFTNAPAPPSSLGSLQQTAARSLGLVFQLDAIDYERPNFRNSDLSLQEIQALLASPSTNGASAHQEFENLVQFMQGGTFLSTVIDSVLYYIGSDPKLRGSARLMLIEILGGLRGDLSQIQGLPPDLQRLLQTLIESRNQKVMADLKRALQKMPPQNSIAIFYGTGHMDNLEKQLRAELHYRPAEDQWYTAFSVNLAESGISPAAAEMIRWFSRKQIEKLLTPGGHL